MTIPNDVTQAIVDANADFAKHGNTKKDRINTIVTFALTLNDDDLMTFVRNLSNGLKSKIGIYSPTLVNRIAAWIIANDKKPAAKPSLP